MSNIINSKSGEWGLTVADMRNVFAQRGQVAMVSEEFEGDLEEFSTYSMSPRPEFDSNTQRCEQAAPVFVAGVLTQQWTVVALSPAEQDALAAERAAQEQEERAARRLVITRTQGLITLYRLKGVTESDVQALIDQIPAAGERYEAGLYFRAASWHSDDKFVLQIAPAIGAHTESELRALFEYAQKV